MRNLLVIIVMLGAGLLPKQAQPCHGSGSWPVDKVVKQDNAQIKEKQEKVLRAGEVIKTEEENLSHPQKEGRKFGQSPSGLSSYKEDVLKLMEEQEILPSSGKVY